MDGHKKARVKSAKDLVGAASRRVHQAGKHILQIEVDDEMLRTYGMALCYVDRLEELLEIERRKLK